MVRSQRGQVFMPCRCAANLASAPRGVGLHDTRTGSDLSDVRVRVCWRFTVRRKVAVRACWGLAVIPDHVWMILWPR